MTRPLEARVSMTHAVEWRRSDATGAPRRFAMPAPSREEIRSGILYMVAAVFVFSLINAAVKWEAARYPIDEIVFLRCVFSLVPCVALVATRGGLRLMRTRRLKEHMGRAALQFISVLCIFAAYGMMPLADAVAISYSSPLFLTMLSIPLLGERVGRHRWGAVLIGFVGVLVMVVAGGGMRAGLASTGAVLALASAGIGASVTIAVRRMTLTEASPALVTYQAVFTTILSAALLPFSWETPAWKDFLILGGIGLCSGIGQFWWTQAFRFAPAAVAAPFSYLSLLWALILGYLVWGDVPTLGLLAGGAVVAASGLYILYRETIRRAPTSATAPGGSD
jgi:drug/metabolite transporter (DMT)-like permease